MRFLLFITCIIIFACKEKDRCQVQTGINPVMLGIDNLISGNLESLSGKRAGLLTNPSGVNRSLQSTLDILSVEKNVNLTVLFAAEHGIRGEMYAGEKIKNRKDVRCNLPVYTIYVINQQVLHEIMNTIDIIIIDIQDTGIRSYTYIYSMATLMKLSAKHNKKIIVLDRPNPINGTQVEGNIIKDGFFSSVGLYPIPYRHGMTIAELALLFNNEFGIGCDLTVVPLSGWERKMFWSETGLQWIPPSPHVPDWETILYMCATGIIGELKTISNGVGYTTPFKLIGAPWINGQLLSNQLNNLQLKGITFRPVYYKPFYALYTGKLCQGVRLFITDKIKFKPFNCSLHILKSLVTAYPDCGILNKSGGVTMFNKVIGTDEILNRIKNNTDIDSLEKNWQKELSAFFTVREKYLLY